MHARRPHTVRTIAGKDSRALVDSAAGRLAGGIRAVNPHFIDTRAVPWIENPAVPDMGLKILRVSEDDLIYTANVYGPLQFDSGQGTPIVAVQSWMQYKAMADRAGALLVRNTFEGDASQLAWTPLGSAVARL